MSYADCVFTDIADRLTEQSNLPPRATNEDWAPEIRAQAEHMAFRNDGMKAGFERAAPGDKVMQELLAEHYEAMRESRLRAKYAGMHRDY